MKFFPSILLLVFFFQASSFVLELKGQSFSPVYDVEKTTHTYAKKDGEELQFDLYRPVVEQDTTARMTLIWMHGGGFAGGTRDNKAEVELMLNSARRGYIAISISYRLTRQGKSFSCDAPRGEKLATFRAASTDLWDAIAYAVENRDAFNIDTSKLIIGGSSAGAEGVLNAIYMKDWLFEGPSKYDSIRPAMVFSLAGAMIDIRYLTENNAVPAIFFHGTKDNLVPYATAPHHYCSNQDVGYIWLDGSRTIADRLKALNVSYLLYTAVDAKHEMAGIPFDKMEMVYQFFEEVIHQKKTVQKEYTVFPY